MEAVLLMSAFEQRLSFQTFYFITSDLKIIVKCRWGSGGSTSSAVGSWRSLGRGSGSKISEKLYFFTSRRETKSLK